MLWAAKLVNPPELHPTILIGLCGVQNRTEVHCMQDKCLRPHPLQPCTLSFRAHRCLSTFSPRISREPTVFPVAHMAPLTFWGLLRWSVSWICLPVLWFRQTVGLGCFLHCALPGHSSHTDMHPGPLISIDLFWSQRACLSWPVFPAPSQSATVWSNVASLVFFAWE